MCEGFRNLEILKREIHIFIQIIRICIKFRKDSTVNITFFQDNRLTAYVRSRILIRHLNIKININARIFVTLHQHSEN